MATDQDGSVPRFVRISNISEEPKRMLMPISGYEEMPLVTLEEAVVPLISVLPRIKDYVCTAKTRCNPVPADGLTQDESASVILYTMDWQPHDECLFIILNATLRTEDRRKLEPWFLYLKLILTALSRLPSTRQFVYRGIKMDLSGQYPQGKTFVWWGFSSCTSSAGVLQKEQFLGKAGERTLFTIDCDSGKDIRRHSYYQSEEEILLLPARQFQVKSCLQPASGLHIIQLIEIESPITPLEPVIVCSDTNQLSLGQNNGQPKDSDKNIQMPALSEIHSASTEQFGNVIDMDDIILLIANGIILILGLKNNEDNDQIINDLLENGRQSLTQYQDKIPADEYAMAMNGDHSELMKFLKIYFEQQWKFEYGLSNEWFILFLKQYQDNDNTGIYEHVLDRTAQYGNKYMKNCPTLSIVLQLLFEHIDDQCLVETNLFNELWFTVINNGLKSITKYSDYMTPLVTNEQINKKQTALFQALCEYHRQELFQLFEESKITNNQNLYDLALDNVAEHGWINGLKNIQERITPNEFQILFQNLESFLKQRNLTLRIIDDTLLTNEQLSSTLIETTASFNNTLDKKDFAKLRDIKKLTSSSCSHQTQYQGLYKNNKKHGRGILFLSSGEQYVGDWIDEKKNGQGLITWPNNNQFWGTFKDDQKHGHGTLILVNGEKYVGDWIDDKRNGQGEQTWSNGDKYVGDWLDGKSKGHGVFTWRDGKKYVGDWADDKINGQGEQTWPNGDKYVGGWTDDKRNGQGQQTWANGGKYIGGWIDDKRNGQGEETWANGGKYIGDWIGDKRNGQGKQAWPNGDKYVGDWVDGKSEGRGVCTWRDGQKYVGDWVDDMRNRHGVCTWRDGKKYVGDWFDDMRNGHGRCTWRDGKKYVGDWTNDKKHGQGEQTWRDGQKYIGGWTNDKRNGQGEQTWPNGDKYIGNWTNDKRNGQGEQTWLNGDKYVGDWIDDKRNGEGEQTRRDGQKYIGGWTDDKRNGQGEQTWLNGDKYVGDWVNDKIQGYGVYTCPSGERYEGSYLDNRRHGHGTFRSADGTVYDGEWVDGQRKNSGCQIS